MMRKLMVLVVVFLLQACAGSEEMVSILPNDIGAFHLPQAVSGQEALSKIDRLHGKAIKATDGVVGFYEGPGKELQIWISRAGSADEARTQVVEMVHLMYENSKSPFTWQKRIDFKKVPIYLFTGMGQVHLVFHRENLVYWLTVNQGQEETALAAFIKE